MNRFRTFRPGDSTRAAPRVLLLLACAGLACTGCRMFQPDPCREPGPIRKLSDRLLHRNKQDMPAYVEGCEPALIGNDCGTINSGTPVITSPGVFGGDAPPLEMSPLSAPGGPITPAPANAAPQGTLQSGAGRAVYETMKPANALSARDAPSTDVARASPTTGRGSDPLDQLPRLDPPDDLGAVPTEAEKIPDPGSSGVSQAATPPMPDAEAVSLAPGIRSFRVVEPRLAGGSLPTAAGWSWLAAQGYKTVIDLRPFEQHRPEDLAAVNSSGLRYVALATPDNLIDNPAHLARFASELSQDSARPIYFFDTDGARAAVLWYLHAVADLKASADEARRVAEEIGPRVPDLWSRADALIAKLKPTSPVSQAPEFLTDPVPEPATPPAPPVQPASMNDAPAPTGFGLASIRTRYEELIDPTNPIGPARDPAPWRPYAALAATGLAVPLALVGRSAIHRFTAGRASLPAPTRATRSIPFESGA